MIALDSSPSKRSDRMLASVAVLVSIVCLVLVTTFPWGRDQSIYGVIGDGILHGRAPYRDLWDFKPPGIYFVYAFAQFLFGPRMQSIRLLEALSLAVMVVAFVVLAKKLQGNTLAGWVAGAIAVFAHYMLDFWHTAQPESFGGILTVTALALVVPLPQKTTGVWAATIAGVALGLASLMKPPLGGGIIVILAYVLRQQSETNEASKRSRVVAGLVLGAGLAVVLVALYFLCKGAWPAMSWTLREFVPGYTSLGWHAGSSPFAMVHYAMVESVIKFSAYIPIGIVATLVLPSAHIREKEGIFLVLGLVSFQLVGVAMQAKFFEYHYGATIPLLAFLAGLGWAKLWWTAQSRGVVSVLAFSATLLMAALIAPSVHDLPGTPLKRTLQRLRYLGHWNDVVARERLDDSIAKAASFDLEADRDVARWMKGQTGINDTVLVWGFEPAIYWLSQRKPATRFIYNVPQRSSWQQTNSRRWFMDDLLRTRPTVIVVQHSDLFPGVTGRDSDSAADLASFPDFAQFVEREYFPAGYRYNFEYYRRRN